MDKVLIWDAEERQPSVDCTTVLWRGFSDGATPDVVSIPQLIEKNADALRTRYLAWVYELGEWHIKGCRLIDHLELRPGFSYWWMTLFVEKCNFSKSSQIDDAIRLLAFTDWASGRALSCITLASANQPLADCLRGWCEKSGVSFEWRQLIKPAVSMSWARRAYTTLPAPIQALAWLLRYLVERWPLRGVGLQAWQKSEGRVTFFSYSDNCVPDPALQARFESRYWAHLPDVLKREACKTNWLHLYVKDDLLSTARRAAAVFRAFNKNEQGQQCHVTLDTFLGSGAVLRTLRNWLRLTWVGARVGGELSHAHRAGLNLWPLLRKDWCESMFGATAMGNLLYYSLFVLALKRLPEQQQGVYLQENQGWEFGMIHAWKAAGHGRLIGTPHSTVRFWDLRYFFDPRSYVRSDHNDLPMPNLVACNGPAMQDNYRRGSYPVGDLVDVEALRYLYLDKDKIEVNSIQAEREGPVRLLVLGEYVSNNTQRQMKLLEKSIYLLRQEFLIIVKPHPNCPIHAVDYPTLRMQVTMAPISELLTECDVAYSSAVTSAAVDAYCAGVPIVSVLDPNALNLSPLRGCAGALFASTPEELASALTSMVKEGQVRSMRQAYFTVNVQLPHWRRLLLA